MLNDAGVVSVQEKWDEMFSVKEEIEEEKPKKPVKKRTIGKKVAGDMKTTSKKTKVKKKIG